MTRVVVTGGSKGIGRAVAERLAGADARIIVNYHRDEAAAAETVAAIRERGAWAEAVAADACGVDGARALADAAGERLGGVDALVHCAVWTPPPGALLGMPPERLREGVERNGCSLLWLVQAFDGLLADGAGVVFLSSRGAVQAVPGYGAVGPAKALSESLVRYLAAELAPRGIRVNTVSAGPVDTEALRSVAAQPDAILASARRRNPSGRDITPADVAGAVAFLVGADARLVQGDVLHVDGGLRLV